VKYAFIKGHAHQHTIKLLCKTLMVSRSGYYSWLHKEPSAKQLQNRVLVREIAEIHGDTLNVYGSPRMHVELRSSGHVVSLGRVERLMRSNALGAKQGRKNQQKKKHRNADAPAENILDRQFSADAMNSKWVSDITFIETREGFLYLAIILDLFSRAIVGWSMSDKIDEQLVQSALSMAIERRKIASGLLLHSDQGSQYKAKGYQQRLADLGIVCSMSRKGQCHDNAVAESFFHTLKTELVCNHIYKSRNIARQAIFKYVEIFYNRRRRHSALNYQSPYSYEMLNVA
jgi:putative transposase